MICPVCGTPNLLPTPCPSGAVRLDCRNAECVYWRLDGKDGKTIMEHEKVRGHQPRFRRPREGAGKGNFIRCKTLGCRYAAGRDGLCAKCRAVAEVTPCES